MPISSSASRALNPRPSCLLHLTHLSLLYRDFSPEAIFLWSQGVPAGWQVCRDLHRVSIYGSHSANVQRWGSQERTFPESLRHVPSFHGELALLVEEKQYSLFQLPSPTPNAWKQRKASLGYIQEFAVMRPYTLRSHHPWTTCCPSFQTGRALENLSHSLLPTWDLAPSSRVVKVAWLSTPTPGGDPTYLPQEHGFGL